MRRLDRWVGTPVCAGLTLLRRLTGRLRRPPDNRPRRILVVKLAEQGATVLACGALRRAVERVGRENVFFLVFQENRFILDIVQIIPEKNVIAIRTHGLVRLVIDALAAIRRMRRERIDSALDFEFFARSSAALTYLSGAARRVGLHAFAGEASYRGDLMTHRISCNPFLHASQVFEMLVEALYVPPEQLPALDIPIAGTEHLNLPQFQPQDGELAHVREALQAVAGRDAIEPIILLNANCSDLLRLRRWPADRYVALARRLLDRYPEIRVVFTGAPAEEAGARELVARIGSDRCFSMAGRTSLRELLVLYCLAEVLVTNDSGPAHFATVTPVDVITLFGPETPALFGARSPRSHILWSAIVCSPCVNAYNDRQSSCPDNICLQRISVDDVFAECCRVYDARRGHTA